MKPYILLMPGEHFFKENVEQTVKIVLMIKKLRLGNFSVRV